MQSIFILGRQPALGLAELESLYGAQAVQPVGTVAALVQEDLEPDDFARIGGSTRLARILATLDTTDWKQLEKHLIKTAPAHAGDLPEGKLTIGISTYGLRVSPAAVGATGLSIKKAIRKHSGKSVRLVPNKETELNTAQVLHNKLTGTGGWELLLIRDGDRTILAQTSAAQDIDSYTLRDRGRPKRDARVGMLPPKLAQIIINLASTRLEDVIHPEAGTDSGAGVHGDITMRCGPEILLDPFCGTGVVLLEARLMGYDVYGTDLEQRMIDYSAANLAWLDEIEESIGNPDDPSILEQGDATTHRWKPVPDLVACETYLGRPFTSPPIPEVLAQTMSEVNLILKKFLKNIGGQIESGTRLCLAVPAWQVRPGRFKHLPLIDSLEEMGYNRISFEHVRPEELLYYRPDQVVARQLLVLVKK